MGEIIVKRIEARQERLRLSDSGPLGAFYRAGGNNLLFKDLPISKDDLVIDAGGYFGHWTAGIITRYGCHSEIFEPVPAFAQMCTELFQHNRRVIKIAYIWLICRIHDAYKFWEC